MVCFCVSCRTGSFRRICNLQQYCCHRSARFQTRTCLSFPLHQWPIPARLGHRTTRTCPEITVYTDGRKLHEPHPRIDITRANHTSNSTVAMESSSTTAAGSAGMASKPKPKDFSHYYSVTTAHRIPSAMKAYYKFFQIPGIGNLAGGKHSPLPRNCP